MLTDSHCHIDDYSNLAEVLERAEDAGVGTLLAIGIGDGPATMAHALQLAQSHSRPGLQIFATAGIHPQEAHQATPENLAGLEQLVQISRCVAVGEIGLDYYHIENPDVEIQKVAFLNQMRVAIRVRKPITIHCRTSELAGPKVKERFGYVDAWEDILALIAEHWSPTGLPGIMHCFSGDRERAERALAAGFYLSFAGNVTYPKSTALQEVAKAVPADRLLVETDAPFLAPQSRRGQQNEPAYITETVAFLAELRNTTSEEIAAQTTANFHRLFPFTSDTTAAAAS